ncbi:NfeD family protein [Desulfopila inferna]|uniref:NfeD family protein n=1 Tax=Desulfopila inferna TaxID=468528 RepID=UPI001966C672|nr:hypothetical protein [Desulfopila inferna]MBM9604785.1 hypothetical protein [Desulfopila inferna]
MVLTTAGLLWLVMGGMCIVLGMLVPGFMVFFFGLGALITAVISLMSSVSILTQLVIFLGTSLAMLYLLKNRLEEIFPGDDLSEDE